jgi:hypothetical protein
MRVGVCEFCGEPEGACLWDPDGVQAHDFRPALCPECDASFPRREGSGLVCCECGAAWGFAEGE